LVVNCPLMKPNTNKVNKVTITESIKAARTERKRK
jgi:hypothetical protein